MMWIYVQWIAGGLAVGAGGSLLFAWLGLMLSRSPHRKRWFS